MAAHRARFRRIPLSSFLEAGTLLSLVVIGGALWIFTEIVDEVVEGESHAVDRAVLLALRDPSDPTNPLGPAWLEEAFRDLTGLGGGAVLMLMTIAVAGYLVIEGKRSAAWLVALSIASGALITTALKLAFDRARPDVVTHLVEVESASFPSGHAMLSTVVYLTLGALVARTHGRRRAKIYIMTVAVLLTLLVGLSRVYLGVHWPTDVFAGWSVGAAWAMLCWRIALFLQRRGKVEAEADVSS